MKSTLLLISALFIIQLNLYAQWVECNSGMGFESVGALYADSDTLYAGTTFDVFKSTNEGNDWSANNNGLPAVCNFYAIIKSGNYIVAGGDSPGIWKSSDNGANWVRITTGVDSDEYVLAFYVDGNNLFAAFGFPAAIGFSTDNGTTWTKSTDGISSSNFMTGITKLGSTLFATHSTLGVYVSTNNGVSWALPISGIGAQDKNAIVTSGSNLCVGTTNGVWLSTDAGTSWTHPLTSGIITGLNTKGNEVFAVGVLPYKSTDNGVTWNPLNADGLPGTIWNTIQFTTNFAFVNFLGVGVYRRSISEVTGINEEQINFVTDKFWLEQNYPNPFNPITNIEYSIPYSGFVSLKLYDILGNTIMTLVNEEKDPRVYIINLNASELSSGIYYYQLFAGNDLRITRKMILIK